ncbi:tellurite resistance TerB family protein [Neisseria chenwenguii]|uniref:Uncharacterized protein n=1 Tax=Neisseria chenwenguii TaxID=1853278 RepID=A0A220S1Z1_9NEIS|nr:DUF533 domain-containing protein [Neisseria chenwenguii]ASK27378.1 hypothetical protein BG910_06165 [Neisseria chenwenguii]ROV56951.1 DUF533 domain-containing protein [Neisseria chenwenguii]
MNLNSLLNQVLNTVQKSGGKAAKTASDNNLLGTLGGSALAAGVASMLFKKKNAGSLLKVGSLAALGVLAYKAYQSRQESNPAQPAPEQSAFQPTGQIAEDHSRTVLRAMIAAAASDGLIDDAEKQLIAQEGGGDAETSRWLMAEYANPATVADLAREVGGNQALAAEVYLAARAVCADLSRKEIVFLAQLSEALELDDALVEKLEQQLGL